MACSPKGVRTATAQTIEVVLLTAREYIQLATSVAHASSLNINGAPLLPVFTALDLIKNFVEGVASYSVEGNTINFKVDGVIAEPNKEPTKLAIVRTLPTPEPKPAGEPAAPADAPEPTPK